MVEEVFLVWESGFKTLREKVIFSHIQVKKYVLLRFVDELTVSLAVEYLSIDKFTLADLKNEKPLKYRQGFKPRSLLVATGLYCPRTREPTKEERKLFISIIFFGINQIFLLRIKKFCRRRFRSIYLECGAPWLKKSDFLDPMGSVAPFEV